MRVESTQLSKSFIIESSTWLILRPLFITILFSATFHHSHMRVLLATHPDTYRILVWSRDLKSTSFVIVLFLWVVRASVKINFSVCREAAIMVLRMPSLYLIVKKMCFFFDDPVFLPALHKYCCVLKIEWILNFRLVILSVCLPVRLLIFTFYLLITF